MSDLHQVSTLRLVVALAGSLVLTGCNTVQQPCDAFSCASGCCASNGQCVIAPNALACGTAGATCQACLLDEQCELGRCTVTSGAGGGTPQTGGGGGGGGGREVLQDGGVLRQVGRVSVVQLDYGSLGTQLGDAGVVTAASGFFLEGQAASSWPELFPHCSSRVLEGCLVTECDALHDGGFLEGGLSAGTVAVRGLRSDSGVDLEFSDAARGYPLQPTGRLAAGELVRISGSGAGFPAFSGIVRSPLPILLTSPARTGGAGVRASRGAPLRVTWTHGTQGDQVYLQLGKSVSSPHLTVECEAESGGGAFEFPPVLLSLFSSGAADLAVLALNTTTVIIGESRVDLIAQTVNLDSMSVRLELW